MIKLRAWICAFLFWLVVFFNMERLAEQVNMASFVYIYIPLIAVLVLFLPKILDLISEKLLILILVILFFMQKLALGYLIFDRNLPITIMEICCIGITYYFARTIGKMVADFEEAIASLTFQQIGLAPRLYDTTDTEDLYREVKRCRRFQHPLSLMIVRSRPIDSDSRTPNKLLKEMLGSFSTRYAQARLAKMYSDKLRDTDLVVLKKDELVVVLPETTSENAQKLLNNLRERAKEELDLELFCGLSSFPDHSVTLGGLLEYAGSDLEQDLAAQKGR
ncbi:MAG: hypothetical protein KKC20_01580 [Proteobacteria bacterium]|nr:hypothetical protein [Pseudomonadota bacterium]